MTGEICRFWLIVTGKGEEEFLPDLFRGLTSRALCTFKVIYRMPQSDPITSPKRLLKMVHKGQTLTTKDEDTALKIRGRLYQDRSSYAMIVDDIERARREGADKVFARYRTALDTILTPVGMQSRASVHFLVNMLEAYYFAHSAAVNAVAGVTVLAQDHATDVEQIGHPKGELKACWKGFDEIGHGRRIVPRLDLEHILARPAECCGLRTMIAWCVTRLIESDVVWDQSLATSYQLADGCRCPITSGQ